MELYIERVIAALGRALSKEEFHKAISSYDQAATVAETIQLLRAANT